MTTGIVSAPSCRLVSFAQLRRDLVERREDESVELDLAHRPVAAHRETDRGADDARLRERRVEHAVRAELGLQALGDAEDAAERADVLAHEQHLRRRRQRLAQAGVEGALSGIGRCDGAARRLARSRSWRHAPRRMPRSSASHSRCSSISGCGSEYTWSNIASIGGRLPPSAVGADPPRCRPPPRRRRRRTRPPRRGREGTCA